ncbi:hypothetical protein [Streptomyces sp. WM6378]|uniref:hypothetical protein n=1 Tax=Streptomyces sp. WM6378 TaxID=1415557 RepID=UPI0006AE5E4E|nr:hypothetical protein [Streptomyces sp. WM6378]KOU33694.1 hypothetical protein ADK54_41765 [Streptomyces sp. WM6378]
MIETRGYNDVKSASSDEVKMVAGAWFTGFIVYALSTGATHGIAQWIGGTLGLATTVGLVMTMWNCARAEVNSRRRILHDSGLSRSDAWRATLHMP